MRDLGVRIFIGEEAELQFGKPLPDPEWLRRETDAAFVRLRQLLDQFRQHAERGPGLTRYLVRE